jgi:histidinol-phosphate/aromatic aminotransferase/cobyric acid decarboxylase-like protein
MSKDRLVTLGGAPARSKPGCEDAPDVQLNLNVRGLAPSATVAINERSDRLRRDGRKVFKMGLGQSPFPVPAPVTEALRQNAHQKAYLAVHGLRELRQAVAEHHRREMGISTSAENVLIGPGSKELMFILQLVYYGDLVIPTPTWVSYAPQAHIIGRHVKWLPTSAANGWRLTARMAYVDFDGEGALEAARSLPSDVELDDTYLRARCGEVLEAIDRVCDWIEH